MQKLRAAVGAANLAWDRRGDWSNTCLASGSRSTGCKLCQFGCRDCYLRKAAVQADQQDRKHPDAGFFQICEPGEMYENLARKFGLIMGTA
jgi:hypothetical protein